MNAPDTSVLVAGLSRTHPFYELAGPVLASVERDGVLVAHTIAEVFAVLSAPSSAFAVPAADVRAYLGPYLDRGPVGIAADRYPDAIEELARHDVIGGGVYDGLIAIAARDAGVELVSLDVRAVRTYKRVGVQFQLLL